MERDFPKGHPAANDYSGERYIPPRAPYAEDFPPGHPARHGANIDELSTADGSRARVLEDHARNAYQTAQMERQAAASE